MLRCHSFMLGFEYISLLVFKQWGQESFHLNFPSPFLSFLYPSLSFWLLFPWCFIGIDNTNLNSLPLELGLIDNKFCLKNLSLKTV